MDDMIVYNIMYEKMVLHMSVLYFIEKMYRKKMKQTKMFVFKNVTETKCFIFFRYIFSIKYGTDMCKTIFSYKINI